MAVAVVGKIFLSDSDGDDAAAPAGNLSRRRRLMRLVGRPPFRQFRPLGSLGRSSGRTFGRKFIPDSRYQLLIREETVRVRPPPAPARRPPPAGAVTVCGSDRARLLHEIGRPRRGDPGERLVGLQNYSQGSASASRFVCQIP